MGHALGLVSTTSARWRSGFWVATPVGQRSVWQLCDCMQPSANMKPRAALHQSAPSARTRAMSKPVMMRAARSEADGVAQARADQRVVGEDQALAQRRSDVVGEFERRRAGAAFRAVDDDEVGADPGFAASPCRSP